MDLGGSGIFMRLMVMRKAMESLAKEKQQRSVQTKLDSFFKPASLRSKTITTSESSIDE
jgi:hypothetical protein